jgi:CDP-4-dehydro-6-deoxyglucose reductase
MAFQVLVRPSGRHFTVEADESLLGAALRQGVGMPYGCRDGSCGACKCRRLSGETVHRSYHPRAMTLAEEAGGFVLPCCASVRSDIVLESSHVGAEDAPPIRRMPARVLTMRRVSVDVMILRIALPGAEGLAWRAGQYLDVLLRDGERRSYSIAQAPGAPAGDRGIELHIRHMPGGLFTSQVFDAMKERDLLRVEGPHGSFFLRDSAKPIVLLASGTGFAPIKALIEQMRHAGVRRQAILYWGGRRPPDLYMHDWVVARCGEMANLAYVPVVSDPQPGDGWTGRTGFVHRAVLEDIPDLSGHQVYACGAPIVIDSARADYTAAGRLPAGEFFADSFISAADRAVIA